MSSYFDLDVSLLDIEPRIWRRFLLTDTSTFEELHAAIQEAFGWKREHLYEFRHFDDDNSSRPKSVQPIRRIARCRQAEILDDEVVPFADELMVASFFAEKDDRCLYLYDFGDGWQHVVQLNDFTESTDSFTRRLIDGAMACPPENCGGPIGYEELTRYLAMTEEQVGNSARLSFSVCSGIAQWIPIAGPILFSADFFRGRKKTRERLRLCPLQPNPEKLARSRQAPDSDGRRGTEVGFIFSAEKENHNNPNQNPSHPAAAARTDALSRSRNAQNRR